MKKKQIASITFFTIVITYLALYFQWPQFFEDYGLFDFNLFVSILFLLGWAIFSFYWGINKKKKYKKFIIVYWGINIFASIVFCILAKNKLTKLFVSPFYHWYAGPLSLFELAHIFAHCNLIDSVLFPFYIWCGGPLYGLKYMIFAINRLDIDRISLMLITSPLGMIFSFIGYWIGCWTSKLKKS